MARVEGFSGHQENAFNARGMGVTVSALAADLKSCFGYAVGSIAARLGEVASSLADAIGEPPQRILTGVREEHDLMLLAINFFVLCRLASLVLFVLAFCASP